LEAEKRLRKRRELLAKWHKIKGILNFKTWIALILILAGACFAVWILHHWDQKVALLTPTPTPTPKMSDDQIRAENEKVFQRLSNVGQWSTHTPTISDDQIRAENEKVFQRLKQEKSNVGQ
jgi:cytosine/uracil/thiamine/allantoin permease